MSDIYVISTGRNCQQYIRDWYASLYMQSDTDFTCLAIDDASTDKTFDALLNFVGGDLRFIIMRNVSRQWALYNKSVALSEYLNLKDDDVIVSLDLDDQLHGALSLSHVRRIFSDPDVWFSYGSMVPFVNFAQPLNWDKPIRQQSWRTSHLRAYRWGLLRNIRKKDLQNGDNSWLKFPEDRILTYPMLEMAGPEHVYCNKEILYQYRVGNPDSDCKVNKDAVADALSKIKQRSPYSRKTWEQINGHRTDWDVA